jgi:hypothetical protein
MEIQYTPPIAQSSPQIPKCRRPARLRFVGKIKPETTVMGGFLGSAVVSTASVGVPPTESLIRPQPTNNSEMHGQAATANGT